VENIGDRHIVRAAITQAPKDVMHDNDAATAAVGSSLRGELGARSPRLAKVVIATSAVLAGTPGIVAHRSTSTDAHTFPGGSALPDRNPAIITPVGDLAR
jgi:hypothetical protein